jgi:hypothetical protein
MMDWLSRLEQAMMTKDAKIDAQTADHPPAPGTAATGGPRRRVVATWLGVVLAAVVVVGGGLAALAQDGAFGGRTSTTAAASPTVTTAFLPASAQVPVYTADWTQGADGWTLPAGWSTQNGQLVADTTVKDEIPVPFLVVAPRYSIQLDLQGMRAGFTGGNHIFLIARDLSGIDLYDLAIFCYAGGSRCDGQTGVLIDHPAPGSSAGHFHDSFYGPSVQTFELRVTGSELMRCVTDCDWNGTSALPLSPVHLFLVSQHIQLKVTRFAITIP